MGADSSKPKQAIAFRYSPGQKVTVMGLGLFGGGVSVARFLCQKGLDVLVTDLRKSELLKESIQALKDLPIRYRLGEHVENDFVETDLVIANPAVSPDSPYLKLARSKQVSISSELDLFLDFCPAPSVAVTGTNGKSTTTSLIGEILQGSKAFRRVWIGGNIGCSLLEMVDRIRPEDLVVLEVSSFQLESLQSRKDWPRVAVCTRLTPDHLDRHGNFRNYVEAKSRILEFQSPEAFAVLNADDPELRAWKARCKGKTLFYGSANSQFRVERGEIVYRWQGEEQTLMKVAEVSLPGNFNLENVMAATAACLALGASSEAIREGIRRFPGLEHRLELLGEKSGAHVYNNAVSTSPESTISAIQALQKPIVLIAGGKGKNLRLDDLAGEIARGCREAIFFGAVGREIAAAVHRAGNDQINVVDTLKQALDLAFERIKPGDCLLFSPAFSSYDQYRNFRERGEEFRRRVESWLGKSSRSTISPESYKHLNTNS